ncbi:MAG: TPM domain-containing protein [Pedobacter sp.]|nr:MAG: TPM domain-containing protein [Pedobacter sp.]
MSIFNTEEQELITNAVAEAESKTSGEIRVALEKHCTEDPKERALKYFYDLEMDATSLKNGVLIYLAYEDHKFAIIGDKGINDVVPADFWETTKVAMRAHFMAGNLAEGIVAGIKLAGEKLALYFPYQTGDINELPNEIVYFKSSESKAQTQTPAETPQ